MLHDYQYECGNGHYQAAHSPLKRCVHPRCDQPQLKRVGKGSRAEAGK